MPPAVQNAVTIALCTAACTAIVELVKWLLSLRKQKVEEKQAESDDNRADLEVVTSAYKQLLEASLATYQKISVDLTARVAVLEDELKSLKFTHSDCEKEKNALVAVTRGLNETIENLKIERNVALRAQEKAEGAYMANQKTLAATLEKVEMRHDARED